MTPEVVPGDRLKQFFQKNGIVLAYLFGSRVAGRANRESDVDVGVLFRETEPEEGRLAKRLDLIGVLSQEFDSDRVDLVILNEASPLLAFEVLRGGLLLYCADEDARVEFQVRSLRRYEDTAALRKILSTAMEERLREGSYGVRLVASGTKA